MHSGPPERPFRGFQADKTTIPDKKLPCPLDKVNRQFRVPAPNMLRVSDFTYVATWKGFAHAASSSKPIPRRGPWRSFEAVDYATLEWVDRFNNRRLLEPVRTVPPAEAEANYHAALETEAMAA